MDTLVNMGKYSSPMDGMRHVINHDFVEKSVVRVFFPEAPLEDLPLPYVRPSLNDWVTGAQPTASHEVPNVLKEKKWQNCHLCDIFPCMSTLLSHMRLY